MLDTPCEERGKLLGGSPGKYYGAATKEERESTGEVYAHRAVWAKANGPIPSGTFVLHKCDNPPCARLDHLFAGTAADNSRDMVAKGRHNSQTNPELRQGERNPQALLTDDQVRDIRRRYIPASHFVPKRGFTVPGNGFALAEEFGVSRDLINKVARRKAWVHVVD